MKTNHIYQGDCTKVLKDFPKESIDLVVTSPPYDNLRDYNGYEFEFEKIARELYRVMKEGGVVVWVVKDAVRDGDRTGTSFRQALKFKEIGFKLYDVIIYYKNNGSPSHKGRYTDCFEYMFVLSKGKPTTINLIEDRENKWGGTETWGVRTIREKDGSLTKKKKSKVKKKGRRFNIWEYSPGYSKSAEEDFAHDHPAIFPEQLAEDHIKSWSEEGDVVLDPMCGSGTTLKMAQKLGRKYIGIDMSEEYVELSRKRVSQKRLIGGDVCDSSHD